MPNTEAVKHLIETRALKERIKAENIDNIDNAFFLVMGYSRKKKSNREGKGAWGYGISRGIKETAYGISKG